MAMFTLTPFPRIRPPSIIIPCFYLNIMEIIMTLSSFRANGRRKSTHSAEASIDLLKIANTDRPRILIRNRSCGLATVRTHRRMWHFDPGLGLILDSYTIFSNQSSYNFYTTLLHLYSYRLFLVYLCYIYIFQTSHLSAGFVIKKYV